MRLVFGARVGAVYRRHVYNFVERSATIDTQAREQALQERRERSKRRGLQQDHAYGIGFRHGWEDAINHIAAATRALEERLGNFDD